MSAVGEYAGGKKIYLGLPLPKPVFMHREYSWLRFRIEWYVKSLREDVKRLETESVTLRKDAEQANKRAQDLALKIVEGGARERGMPSGVVEK